MRVPTGPECEVVLGDERMETVKEVKYLGTFVCKHGNMSSRVIPGVICHTAIV